jgi:hypothetical protein
MEILTENAAEVDLGRAGRRPVIIGQIEVRDAEIKGLMEQSATVGERMGVAKILPKTKGDSGQKESAVPAAGTAE